jgi:hypothetical protein
MSDGCGEVGGMRIGRGNRSIRRKSVPVSLRPPQTPTWTDLRSNPRRWGGKRATNHLGDGTAKRKNVYLFVHSSKHPYIRPCIIPSIHLSFLPTFHPSNLASFHPSIHSQFHSSVYLTTASFIQALTHVWMQQSRHHSSSHVSIAHPSNHRKVMLMVRWMPNIDHWTDKWKCRQIDE